MPRPKLHTLESCIAAAAGCTSHKQFKAKASRAYEAARYAGWLDQVCPKGDIKEEWTRERVAEAAKLYEGRSAMRSGPHQHAYKVARKNGWLDALPAKTGDTTFEITGVPKHPLRGIYLAMVARCTMPSNQNYHRYGGRGIQVCHRWAHGEDGATGFACFIADIGDRPGAEYSIDRKDNDRGYAPDNCRWATPAEQSQNSTKAKLTAGQAAAIKFSSLKTGELVKLYGVTLRTVYKIRSGKAWANIDATHLVL